MINLKEGFHKATEVLVVGGGPAGLAAAVCAARGGAKVMLAEATGCLGGTATSALVGPFMTCYDSAGKNQIIKGFYDELMLRLEKEGGAHIRAMRLTAPAGTRMLDRSTQMY